MAEKGPIKQAIEKPPLKPSGDTYLYIHYIVVAQDLHKFYIWKDILKKLDFIAKTLFHVELFSIFILQCFHFIRVDLTICILVICFLSENFCSLFSSLPTRFIQQEFIGPLKILKTFFLLTQQSLTAEFKYQMAGIVPILDTFDGLQNGLKIEK